MFYSKRIAPALLVIFALFAGQVAAQDDSGDGGGGRSEGRGRGGFGRRGGEGGGGSERGGGDRSGGERGGGGRGGFGGGAFNPAEMFDRLDTNKNGQIEPSERTGRTGQMVEGMAKRAGLDPAQPLSIQKLRETMSSFGRGGPDGGKPGESKDKPADAKAAEEKAAADKKAKQPSFPGFGTKPSAPVVPGFGEVAIADKADKSKPGESPRGRGGRGGEGRGDRRGGGDRSGDDESPAEEAPVSSENKTRAYAESLFKRYDANKNGTLEKEEWSQMSGQPEKADKNGDGKVSLDELADSLASFGKGDDGGSSGKGPSGGGSSSRSGSKGGKPNRFLTATERLPAGLPGWFTRNDADGDGQVMMAEYATTWTTAKVAEFTQYDVNGDGVITPQECLIVDKKSGDKKLADKAPGEKK